jgi:hypothetical protein
MNRVRVRRLHHDVEIVGLKLDVLPPTTPHRRSLEALKLSVGVNEVLTTRNVYRLPLEGGSDVEGVPESGLLGYGGAET